MTDGFLGRWSRRKLEVAEGKPVPAEPAAPEPATQELAQLEAAPPGVPAADLEQGEPGVSPVVANGSPAPSALEEPPAVPPPTMDEVKALTPQSDFSRFAARDVAPEVKNAAMKKLFADPRYNVMDGMDVYIDDYSRPDPIPDHMLRQLASAAFLRLFEQSDEEKRLTEEQAARLTRDVADNPAGETVAQSGSNSPAVPPPSDHADPDLRLQQDDAAPAAKPGDGTA